MAHGSKGDHVRQGEQFCSAINYKNTRFKIKLKREDFPHLSRIFQDILLEKKVNEKDL